MNLDIKEISETLEFNKEDLKGNRELTSELIIDDIMLGLGYNKRRDKSVQRLHDKLIDWTVSTNSGKKLAIKVLAYDEDVETAEDMQDTLDFCANARFSLLIVITGKCIQILRYNKNKMVYNNVKKVTLDSELSATDVELIDAISKDTFNLDFIDSLLSPYLTYKDTISAIQNNVDVLEESVLTILRRAYPDASNTEELAKQFIEKSLLEVPVTDEKADTVADNSEQLEELKNSYEQKITDLNDKVNSLDTQVSTYKSQHEKDIEFISELQSKLEQASATENTQDNSELESQLESLRSELESKDAEIDALEVKLKSQVAKVVELEDSNANTSVDSNIQHKLDAYVEQIRELSVKLSEIEEEKEKALEQVREMQKEIEELSGSDLKFAEQLLESIDDDKDDDRSYVAVINKELLNYEDIHTFIGRCLQKLYDIKAFDASQYIFNGNIFKLVRDYRFSDLIMGNTTYDVELSTDNENEELNKLRVVFSHFDDVVFVCKKIGTLRKNINSRYDIEEEHEEIHLESDEYLQEQLEDEQMPLEDEQMPLEAEQMPLEDEQMPLEDEQMPLEDEQMPLEDEQQEFNGTVPYFDDGLEEEYGEASLERHLLVGQLLNIDNLIWTEEQVKFNTIKYIGTNIITFGINTTDNSYDKLLCKCVDAVLAIEAFNGNVNLVNNLKTKDFSAVNSFLKLYSPEYAQYPRINGTNYVAAGIESVPQVAAALVDVCSLMEIDTQEIFLYLDTETNSQSIIEAYDFSEDAIRLSETTSYIPEDGVEPKEAIAIIKGDMFNHIVITKNSLKVHKEVFLKALAIKTRYTQAVLDSKDKVYEIISEMLNVAYTQGVPVNYRALGNVLGENYLLVSDDESRVNEEHTEVNVSGNTLFISHIEDWQVVHSLIKVHTALFNDTAIAVKSSVNEDAVNYYRTKFETSEPSLGLAVNSFADYIASCVR